MAYSVYGMVWAYNSGYYYWHLGNYAGRAIASTVKIVDWCLNYSELHPYWAVAFQAYYDSNKKWDAELA